MNQYYFNKPVSIYSVVLIYNSGTDRDKKINIDLIYPNLYNSSIVVGGNDSTKRRRIYSFNRITNPFKIIEVGKKEKKATYK